MAVPLYRGWVSLSPGAHTFFWGTVKHCFSVAHHLGGVGNLRVSDFFQFVVSCLHVKCGILITWCVFCFAGSKKKKGKEDESVLLRFTFAQR